METTISLNKIISNLPNLVFWKNTDLVYQGCNQNAARFLGLKSDNDIIGKTDYSLSWDKCYLEQFLTA